MFIQEPLVEREGVCAMAFCHLIEFAYTAMLMIQGGEANDARKAAVYTNARSCQSPWRQKQRVSAVLFSRSRCASICGI